MTVYVAAAARQFGPYALEPGDDIPTELLATIEPESWVAQGHFLALDGNQARALRTARQKLIDAQIALAAAEAAFTTKLDEVRTQR